MDMEAQMKELRESVGSLEKLMQGYKIKLFWYLAILTVSTLGTLSYQVTALYHVHKTGKRIDALLTQAEKLTDPKALAGGVAGLIGSGKDAAKDKADSLREGLGGKEPD